MERIFQELQQSVNQIQKDFQQIFQQESKQNIEENSQIKDILKIAEQIEEVNKELQEIESLKKLQNQQKEIQILFSQILNKEVQFKDLDEEQLQLYFETICSIKKNEYFEEYNEQITYMKNQILEIQTLFFREYFQIIFEDQLQELRFAQMFIKLELMDKENQISLIQQSLQFYIKEEMQQLIKGLQETMRKFKTFKNSFNINEIKIKDNYTYFFAQVVEELKVELNYCWETINKLYGDTLSISLNQQQFLRQQILIFLEEVIKQLENFFGIQIENYIKENQSQFIIIENPTQPKGVQLIEIQQKIILLDIFNDELKMIQKQVNQLETKVNELEEQISKNIYSLNQIMIKMKFSFYTGSSKTLSILFYLQKYPELIKNIFKQVFEFLKEDKIQNNLLKDIAIQDLVKQWVINLFQEINEYISYLQQTVKEYEYNELYQEVNVYVYQKIIVIDMKALLNKLIEQLINEKNFDSQIYQIQIEDFLNHDYMLDLKIFEKFEQNQLKFNINLLIIIILINCCNIFIDQQIENRQLKENQEQQQNKENLQQLIIQQEFLELKEELVKKYFTLNFQYNIKENFGILRQFNLKSLKSNIKLNLFETGFEFILKYLSFFEYFLNKEDYLLVKDNLLINILIWIEEILLKKSYNLYGAQSIYTELLLYEEMFLDTKKSLEKFEQLQRIIYMLKQETKESLNQYFQFNKEHLSEFLLQTIKNLRIDLK